jgi:hypothetical protein
MPENTFDTILTIAEKDDIANHATGIFSNLASKQIVSNATAQAKTKQQSALIQTSNFRHTQNPPRQNNQ